MLCAADEGGELLTAEHPQPVQPDYVTHAGSEENDVMKGNLSLDEKPRKALTSLSSYKKKPPTKVNFNSMSIVLRNSAPECPSPGL